jgi:hypothetical protein
MNKTLTETSSIELICKIVFGSLSPSLSENNTTQLLRDLEQALQDVCLTGFMLISNVLQNTVKGPNF